MGDEGRGGWKPEIHHMVDLLDARNERVVYDFLRWLLRKTAGRSRAQYGNYGVTVQAGQVRIMHPQDAISPEDVVL